MLPAPPHGQFLLLDRSHLCSYAAGACRTYATSLPQQQPPCILLCLAPGMAGRKVHPNVRVRPNRGGPRWRSTPQIWPVARLAHRGQPSPGAFATGHAPVPELSVLFAEQPIPSYGSTHAKLAQDRLCRTATASRTSSMRRFPQPNPETCTDRTGCLLLLFPLFLLLRTLGD